MHGIGIAVAEAGLEAGDGRLIEREGIHRAPWGGGQAPVRGNWRPNAIIMSGNKIFEMLL